MFVDWLAMRNIDAENGTWHETLSATEQFLAEPNVQASSSDLVNTQLARAWALARGYWSENSKAVRCYPTELIDEKTGSSHLRQARNEFKNVLKESPVSSDASLEAAWGLRMLSEKLEGTGNVASWPIFESITSSDSNESFGPNIAGSLGWRHFQWLFPLNADSPGRMLLACLEDPHHSVVRRRCLVLLQSAPNILVQLATTCDYNNDGRLDLFLVESERQRAFLFCQSSTGELIDVTCSVKLDRIPAGTHTACWGDFDSNGLIDLAVAGKSVSGDSSREFLLLCRNTNGKEFKVDNLDPVVDAVSSQLIAGDINRDGTADLLLLSKIAMHRFAHSVSTELLESGFDDLSRRKNCFCLWWVRRRS